MAIRAEKPNGSNPDCIILEDNTIVAWEDTSQEMREQYLQDNRPAQKGNREPDKGNGKEQRKKQRRPRHHS